MDKLDPNKFETNQAPKDGCELKLSADQNWMRFIVDGKQVASFHVNYVVKVLSEIDRTSEKKPHRRRDISPTL